MPAEARAIATGERVRFRVDSSGERISPGTVWTSRVLELTTPEHDGLGVRQLVARQGFA